ncbi:MAG: CocE/NonD family hydrolase [Actinomycetes bacterium]
MLRTVRTRVLAASLATALGATGLVVATATPLAAKAADCRPPSGWDAVQAPAVDGSSYRHTLTSFDGTRINLNWFPNAGASAASPMPTVLMGPGWGQAGDTNVNATGILGAPLSIGALWQAGYHVVTWDPRGFGQSGGRATVDAAAFEGRDVRQIISWVAQQEGVAVDSAGDPRLGMVGGSYGGGIQYVVAATDCRVDAIVPLIAWNSLVTSLGKSGTPKAGWSQILINASAGGRVDPRVTRANREQLATGRVSPATVEFFRTRGPGGLVSRIHQPTLIIQGTVDNLFTPSEAVANHRLMRGTARPLAMAWYCGGHGTCLTDPGGVDPGALSVAWMDRFVKRDRSAAVVEGFEFVDQRGVVLRASKFPPAAGPAVTARGAGAIPLQADGGSGPPAVQPAGGGPNAVVDSIAWRITPGPAPVAVRVPIAVARPATVVGSPRLTMTYAGTTPACTRLRRVFAQIVDTASGVVVGNQITPVPVRLDGRRHRVSLPLEAIAYSATPESRLELQIVGNSTAYTEPCLGGRLRVTEAEVRLPTATGLREVSAG